MGYSSLADLFLKQAEHYRARTALRAKRDGHYHDISWEEFRCRVASVALWLVSQGFRKGDRAAILSENRPEWAYADLGILSAGGVVVPLYATASPKEIERVLAHSEARLLFVSTREQLVRIEPVLSQLPLLKHIVLFDAEDGISHVVDFKTLTASFVPETGSERYQTLVQSVTAQDLATIIYTSGTTGTPKGVMLTHQNFLSNCFDSKAALPITEDDVSLSFLPLSHVFERTGGYYLGLLAGSTIAYAENMNTVPQNLFEVKPTIVCAVPRFFEKTYAQIESTVREAGAFRRKIFEWACTVGREKYKLELAKQPLPLILKWESALAEKLVFSKIYQKLGGRLRFFVSGGAPLPKELAEFFYSAGILILEGYGLTETSPVISVNRIDRFCFGSVGIPLDHVEVKIAGDGEILTRGSLVMKGYYKDEQATREAFTDGWFRTGDLGSISTDGFLFITGRKKDIIVNSGGKKVAPQNIENLILAEPAVNQIVLIGEGRNFLTALIVPNLDEVRRALRARGVRLPEKREALIQEKAVHQFIRERIEEHTQDLAPYEKIKYFTLLAREWSQEGGELTSTLKIKRAVVGERCREVIERMYRETQDKTDEARDRIFFVV